LLEFDYNVDKGFKSFMDKKDLFDYYDLTNIDYEKVEKIKKKKIMAIQGNDKEGRAINWIQFGKVKPDKMNIKTFGQFQYSETMKLFEHNKDPHLASEINIIDCDGFGWENYSFNFYKRFG